MTNNAFQGNNQFNQNQSDYENMIRNRMASQNVPNGYVYQQTMGRSSCLPGRIVFSPEQITPQEIPSDGSPALFPLFDGSKIIVKSFNGNGTFSEDVYVLQQPQTTPIQTEEAPAQNQLDAVISRLDSLEETINKALKDLTTSGKAEPKTQKKAVNSNE